MKNNIVTTSIIIGSVLLVAGVVINYFFTPQLADTALSKYQLTYLFFIPCMFFLLTASKSGRRHNPVKRLVLTTLTMAVIIFISDFFDMSRVIPRLIPTLCGAVLMFILIPVLPKSLLAYKNNEGNNC